MAREKRIDMVILGLLFHEDLTGYDIKKRIDGAISFFWKGSFGNIYPTLKDMQTQALIKSSDTSVGGREKIIYRITEKGKEALKRWLKEDQAVNELRYETLLKLFFSGADSRENALHNIGIFEDRIKSDLKLLKLYSENLKNDLKSEDHLYYYLTVTFGIDSYETYLKWCNKAKKMLKEVR